MTVAFIPTDAPTDFRPRNVCDWIQLDVQGLWFILYIHYSISPPELKGQPGMAIVLKKIQKCWKLFEFSMRAFPDDAVVD